MQGLDVGSMTLRQLTTPSTAAAASDEVDPAAKDPSRVGALIVVNGRDK
jgi:hypothetical protein